MKTLISIIVPVYNVERDIERCIQSILSQSYTNWELILVDDGSPDRCGEIIDDFAKNDRRIRTFHRENSGAGAAREFGVRQAKGEWIMFVDGDDTISPTALEDLVTLDNGQYDIIAGTLNLNNKSTLHHSIVGSLDKTRYIIALLQRETSVGPVAKLFRKSLFDEYNVSTPISIKQNEDLLMLLNLSLNAKRIHITNEIICYNYIYRSNSASKSIIMPLSSWLELFNLIEISLAEIENEQIRIAFFRYKLFMLNVCCIKKGVFIEGYNDFVDALKIESQEYNLNLKDRIMLKRILSIRFQRCTYKYNLVISWIKKSIKYLFGK